MEADSLRRELREIHRRLDSLRAVIERLEAARSAEPEAESELAALRAAARSLVPETPPDTNPEPFVIRSRSLNRLNPEISVTADVRMVGHRPGPQRDNLDIREFAFAFQSALDPYSNTKIFASFGEHGAEVEEAYAYWSGLPGGLRVDLGRFRQQAGELNRWHLHALPESEFPLAIRTFFGHHGLVGNGLSLYWIAPWTSPGQGVHEVWGQVALADNEVLFDNGRSLSVLGHLNNFWQLSRSTFMQFGLTGMYGENPDADLETRLAAADARVTVRSPGQALYRSFTLRAEGFAVRRAAGGRVVTRHGGYVGAEYRTSRRLYVGGRVDYVEPFEVPDSYAWAVVPHLTWWQSEWVFLRAEWQHRADPVLGGGHTNTDRFVLQVVWSIGPHKHENY
jgi:hypothetical protein